MLEWLVPICAFFPAVALYLGGMKTEPAGGNGVQQVLGLLLTLAVYLAAWAGLRMVLTGPVGAAFGGVVFPTLIATLALPVEVRIGYLLVGVKMKRVVLH